MKESIFEVGDAQTISSYKVGPKTSYKWSCNPYKRPQNKWVSLGLFHPTYKGPGSSIEKTGDFGSFLDVFPDMKDGWVVPANLLDGWCECLVT